MSRNRNAFQKRNVPDSVPDRNERNWMLDNQVLKPPSRLFLSFNVVSCPPHRRPHARRRAGGYDILPTVLPQLLLNDRRNGFDSCTSLLFAFRTGDHIAVRLYRWYDFADVDLDLGDGVCACAVSRRLFRCLRIEANWRAAARDYVWCPECSVRGLLPREVEQLGANVKDGVPQE